MITITDVCKWYGKPEVLRNINVTIERNQTVVICGPSGSGKSTLLRCINGIEKYQKGEIIVNGISLNDPKTDLYKLRRDIGMVFQHFALYPHMTALQNICIAPIKVLNWSKRKAEKEAMEFLEQVGMGSNAQSHPAELSGGQQQRVAIGRALIMKPQIVLFDEPTSALDPEMIKGILDIMISLSKSGMTIVCVTHEMGFAKEVADNIIFIDKGEVVEQGAYEEFFINTKTDRAKNFLKQIM